MRWSTVTLFRNSLFNINKHFFIVKKASKMGDEVMKRVSPIMQCFMGKAIETMGL